MSLEIDKPPNNQSLKNNPLRRFDKTSYTWIDFKSESDALLASHWLGEELGDSSSIPIYMLDTLIPRLKQPGFQADKWIRENYGYWGDKRFDPYTYSARLLGEELGGTPSITIHMLGELIQCLKQPGFQIDKWIREDYGYSGDKRFDPYTYSARLTTFLKRSDFQVDKLTYGSGLDILTNIATLRQKVALTRSMKNSPADDQASSRVPSIIVDLVAQELGQCGILPISHWRQYNRLKYGMRCLVDTKEQKALGNMCLVHRTWTIPAQSVLRWCMDVYSPYGLYLLLRNPGLGRSTRMLRYRGSYDTPELRNLLSAIIRKCPGLRALRIDTMLHLKDHQLIEDISNLQMLETLDLGRHKCFEMRRKWPPSPLLLKVCQVLPRMEALKSLTLHCFVCDDEEEIPSSMHELSPFSRLIEINLIGYYHDAVPHTHAFQHQLRSPATIDCIAWLFRQRHDYKITSTLIHTQDIYDLEMDNPTLNEHGLAILPVLANIDALDISGDRYGLSVPDLLSRCTHVKYVKLDAFSLEYMYDGDETVLPETLESLEVNGVLDNFQVEVINSIVQSLPQLRSLHLHTCEGDYVPSYAGTMLLCQQKGIAFTSSF